VGEVVIMTYQEANIGFRVPTAYQHEQVKKWLLPVIETQVMLNALEIPTATACGVIGVAICVVPALFGSDWGVPFIVFGIICFIFRHILVRNKKNNEVLVDDIEHMRYVVTNVTAHDLKYMSDGNVVSDVERGRYVANYGNGETVKTDYYGTAKVELDNLEYLEDEVMIPSWCIASLEDSGGSLESQPAILIYLDNIREEDKLRLVLFSG
jgi:hypothetical protein